MGAAQLTQLASEALLLSLALSAPVLLVTFAVSLAGSALQSVTQVQDSTLLVAPRIAAGLVTLWFAGHWMSDRLSHFAADLLRALAGVAT